MRVLDLFTGIGGFALGLEAAGMTPVAFCESDHFCREWLRQRWPNIPCHADVRGLDGRAVGPVDLICGGFPCQDVCTAGSRRGLAGERSGLWFHMLRLVHELRPTWVLVENVAGLRIRGGDRVLADLEDASYACWPLVVGADSVGLTHRRKRVWIVARTLADRDRWGCESERQPRDEKLPRTSRDLAHGCGAVRADDPRRGRPPAVAPPGELQHDWEAPRTIAPAQCELGTAIDGIPGGMGETYNRARLRAAGNAIVPYIAEILGRVVIRTELALHHPQETAA